MLVESLFIFEYFRLNCIYNRHTTYKYKKVPTRNFTLWIGTHAQLETIKTQDPTVDR